VGSGPLLERAGRAAGELRDSGQDHGVVEGPVGVEVEERVNVLAGHGGAHPRCARNTGTADPQATATRLVPADIQILHDGEAPCVLTLPASPAP
jgi:hypothetical protein